MNFGRRLLIYISPRGGLALLAGWHRLNWVDEFTASDEGIARFSQLLNRHRGTPVTLVVDSVDEDYRLENLPHVFGRARQEMLSRKLRQIFRNAPYSAAIFQDRGREGRKDDHYLMVSLTDSDWLHSWIAAIRSHGIPFAGMTLLSLAAENLLARLKIREPHVLLASRQSGGLRLTYFDQGKLRFSRLTRTDESSTHELNVADEVSKTQLYLTSQRIFPREGRLTVCLLDLSGNLSPTQASLNADPQFDARLLAPDEISRRLGIPAEMMINAPEVAYLAALDPRFTNLAPSAFSSGYQVHRIRRGLLAAGGTALAASAAMAGWNMLQVRADTTQMQQLEMSIRQNDALYQETLRRLPKVPLSAESLARFVETANRIQSNHPTPADAYERLSRVLGHHPNVSINKLSWHNLSLSDPGGAHTEALELGAQIRPFNGNFREAMDKIRSLMSDLSQASGIKEVKLVAEPIDTGSSKTLSGTTLQSAQLPEAHFQLSLKLEENRP